MHDRRESLGTATLTGSGVGVGNESEAQKNPNSPNDQINFACIGVGGMGNSDSNNAARFGNIVAICDVDENILNKKGEQFPNAKKYTDYRKMFEEMSREIDAVTVSTPDHSHGSATAMALHHGKHVYTQKPLAHSIYECRRLGELATKMKVATQMGNQVTANSSLRSNAYKVRAGAIGVVSQVHVWTNRPLWPSGMDRPTPIDPPANLDWNLWLGPAPDRPYGQGYVPGVWKGFWDFGTSALGDMACHTVNLPFMALDLCNAASVQATSSGHNRDSYPRRCSITFEFPAIPTRPAVTMIWYDGGNLPPRDLIPTELLPTNGEVPSSGSLIIGSRGKLYTPGDYGDGGHIVGGVEVGEVKYPESPGHWEEFIRAIRGGEPAMSNFPGYAGPLTETILIGNLAVWPANQGTGPKILWDAEHMKINLSDVNSAELAEKMAHIIKPHYRAGYSL